MKLGSSIALLVLILLCPSFCVVHARQSKRGNAGLASDEDHHIPRLHYSRSDNEDPLQALLRLPDSDDLDGEEGEGEGEEELNAEAVPAPRAAEMPPTRWSPTKCQLASLAVALSILILLCRPDLAVASAEIGLRIFLVAVHLYRHTILYDMLMGLCCLLRPWLFLP